MNLSDDRSKRSLAKPTYEHTVKHSAANISTVSRKISFGLTFLTEWLDFLSKSDRLLISMKKDNRASHKKGMSQLDKHVINAMKVSDHLYFTVGEVSLNEVSGLLVGTEVKRIRGVESWPSKYWNGMYYSVLVECPNGETRRLGCDALIPRKTDKHFLSQSKMFKKLA